MFTKGRLLPPAIRPLDRRSGRIPASRLQGTATFVLDQIHWPVLKCPLWPGFQMSTEGCKPSPGFLFAGGKERP